MAAMLLLLLLLFMRDENLPIAQLTRHAPLVTSLCLLRCFASISIPTVRCLKPRLRELRPFQRKLAFLDQAVGLLNDTSLVHFIMPQDRNQVLWRTLTAKGPVQPDVAWKRLKMIQKDLEKLAEQIKGFEAPGRSHQEAVDLLVDHLFVRISYRCTCTARRWQTKCTAHGTSPSFRFFFSL